MTTTSTHLAAAIWTPAVIATHTCAHVATAPASPTGSDSSSHAVKWDVSGQGERKAFDAYWYEGGMKPPVPEEFAKDPTRQKDGKPAGAAGSRHAVHRQQGQAAGAGRLRRQPAADPRDVHAGGKRPEKSLPRSPGHKQGMAAGGDGRAAVELSRLALSARTRGR